MSSSSASVWSCRRFEVLYRDVILPLIRRSEFQRCRSRQPAPTVNFRASTSLNYNEKRANEHLDANTVTPRSSRRPSARTDFSIEKDSATRRREKYSDVASSVSEGEEPDEEQALSKDHQIQRLWDLLAQQIGFFIRPLGHSTCRSSRGREKGNKRDNKIQNEIWDTAGERDFTFDKNHLIEAIEYRTPELVKVSASMPDPSSDQNIANTFLSSDVETRSTSSGESLQALDTPEAISRRQGIVMLLTELLSSRLNLHQVECLNLLTVNIQISSPDIPTALSVEGCVLPSSTVTPGVQSNPSPSFSISQFGYFLLDSCCTKFRREQLYHLWCLQELALDLYPLDQSGVGESKSVGLVALCFFKELISKQFIENSIASLKFLMFESTRQRVQMSSLSGTPDVLSLNDPFEFSEWVDRAWSRRLAQILVRLLVLIFARFHPSPPVVLAIAELLEGAAFDEQAIRKVKEYCGNSDEDRWSARLTARDFDFAAFQDIRNSEKNTSCLEPLLQELQPAPDVLDMTSVLTLLFLELIDPSIPKWNVVEDETPFNVSQYPKLEDAELPTAKLSEWLCPHTDSGSRTGTHNMTSWLARKSADHDIDTFWIETSTYGRLLSFAVSVAFTRPSDARRLQLALSPSWNMFDHLKREFLDRLGGSSPLAKITVQTIDSLLRQTLLPLNTQWSGQVVRTEKMTRLANNRSRETLYGGLNRGIEGVPGNGQSTALEPVIAVVNRVCSMHPPAIPIYAPIFFALVDSFPWLELTSWTSSISQAQHSIEDYETVETERYSIISQKKRGTEVEVCELGTASNLEDEVPSITGVGFPTPPCHSRSSVCNGISTHSGFDARYVWNGHSERLPRENCTSVVDTPLASEDQTLRSDDIHFLLPLFVEVITFGATICGAGNHSVAMQVATKLTSQPSLLGFFIPHTADRLQQLFVFIETGLLQRQLFSAFQERRSKRLMKLRRGEFGVGYSDPVEPFIASAFFDDEDNEEEDDKRLQHIIDTKISSILFSITAVFKFLVTALSPRLFLTRPPPPPLVPQTGPNAVSCSRILDWVYVVLAATSRSRLGVGELGARLNGLQLLNLKCCVLDGLSGSFETSLKEATRILEVFSVSLLPIIINDLTYLKSLTMDTEDVSPASLNHEETVKSNMTIPEKKSDCALIGTLGSDLAGRLSIAVVTYFTSVITRLGYRQRYSSFSISIRNQESITDTSKRNTQDSLYPECSVLLSLTEFVVKQVLPLIHTSTVRNTLSSCHHWRLSAVVFKFMRCILRGPLPFLNISCIDDVSREPFTGKDTSSIEGGAAATAWLMRAFLTLDSFVLSGLMHLTRTAWQQLLSPWDPSESAAGLFQLQTVETGLDILVTLFQRDTLFLCWWNSIRRAAVKCDRNDAAAGWEFVSGLVPIHWQLMRDNPATKCPTAVAPGTCVPRGGGYDSTDTVPHAVFFFEFVLSDRYRDIRKRGMFILHQLNQREPTKIAALLSGSSYYLGMLQAAMASMLRDIELEEFEHWEYLDSLGLLSNSDFPSPGLPECLLDPFWIEDDTDIEYVSFEARLHDAMTVWAAPSCLEVSTFHEEIAEVDFPSSAVDPLTIEEDTTIGTKTFGDDTQKDPLSVSSVAKRRLENSTNWAYGYTVQGGFCPITSKYTGLPIHKKLERRLNIAEEAAMSASDAAAWVIALEVLDVSQGFKHAASAAMPLLQSWSSPPAPFLLPTVSAKVVTNNVGLTSTSPLFEEAAAALRGEIGNTARNTGFVPLLGQLSLVGAAASSSRALCLQFLKQSATLELDGQIQQTPTSLLLLGFCPVHTEKKNTMNSLSLYTTTIPLPFISSPFKNPDSPTSTGIENEDEPQMNPWLHNSMIVFDSLCLIVENPDIWVTDSCFSLDHNSHQNLSSILGHDSAAVQDVLSDTVNYSDNVLQLYREAQITLDCLELITLLLTHTQVTDATLYLLFVRLPHRHAVLSQLLTTRWDTSPSLLQSIKKMIAASWIQIIASEAHLCSSFISQQNTIGEVPSWIVTHYPVKVLKARLDVFQNQCRQVSEGTWALLHSPIGHTSQELSAVGLPCQQGTPTLLSCLFNHLAAAEHIAVLPYCMMPNNATTEMDTTLSHCRGTLATFHRREEYTIRQLTSPLLQLHQVLVHTKLHHINVFTQNCVGNELSDQIVLDPLSFVLDFNQRSTTLFTVQRITSRLSDLFAASLELMTTELEGSTDTFCQMDYSSLSMTATQEMLEGCIIRCLSALEGTFLKSYKSRYCIVSIIGSLINALVIVLTPSSKRLNINKGIDIDDTAVCDNDVPLNRSFLKTLIYRMLNLTIIHQEDILQHHSTSLVTRDPDHDILNVTDQQNVSQKIKDNLNIIGLDKTLRLRLFLSVSQLIKLSGTYTVGAIYRLLEICIMHDEKLLEKLVKQLLLDLLEPDIILSIHPILLYRPIGIQHDYFYTQDHNALKHLYPGLVLSTNHAAVPLLKFIIDFSLSKAFSCTAPFSLKSSQLNNQSDLEQHKWLPGHDLTPHNQWLTTSEVMHNIQLWSVQVFQQFFCDSTTGKMIDDTFKNTSYIFLPNSDQTTVFHHSSFSPIIKHVDIASGVTDIVGIARLALALIGSLIEKPALCETILAANIPINEINPGTTSSLTSFTPAAGCRTILLSAPFLPRLNAPLTLSDFGLPPFPGIDHSLQHRRDNNIDIVSIWDSTTDSVLSPMFTKPNELSDRFYPCVSTAVAILPVYLSVINKILLQLQSLNMTLMVTTSGTINSLNHISIPAPLFFIRWWLGRDRQFSSCFRCFNDAADILKEIGKQNSTVNSLSISQLSQNLHHLNLSHKEHNVYKSTEYHHLDPSQLAEDNILEIPQFHENIISEDELNWMTISEGCHFLKTRLNEITFLITLTTRIWLRLLTLLLKEIRCNHIDDNDTRLMNPELTNNDIVVGNNVWLGTGSNVNTTTLLSFDDTLLTLQFQSHMIHSAVKITQLATLNCLLRNSENNKKQSLFRTESLRALLPANALTSVQIKILLPSHLNRRQFVSSALQCIRREFDISQELINREDKNGEAHQIREQLKRSLLERTQSLALISNVSLLGLLTVIPLDPSMSQLNREIENFLGVSRDLNNGKEFSSMKTQIIKQDIIFYLRILSLSLCLLSTALETILNLEGVPITLSSIATHSDNRQKTPIISPDNSRAGLSVPHPLKHLLQQHIALLRHILSVVHPSLEGPVFLRAIRLCGRATGILVGMNNIPGFPSVLNGANEKIRSDNDKIPLDAVNGISADMVRMAAKMVCVEALKLQSFLVAISACN